MNTKVQQQCKWPRLEKCDTKQLTNDTDPAYTDLPEIEDGQKGSIQMHHLLLQGSRCCCLKEDETILTKTPKNQQKGSNLILIRCIGSQGCHQTWCGTWNHQHVLGHLAKCTYIDTKLQQDCIEELGSKAIGPTTKIDKVFNVTSMDIDEPSTASVTTKKRKGNKNSGNGKLTTIAVNGGRKKQKENSDYHLMKFIACCGIPPKVIDSAEWKDMMAALNPFYHSPSLTTLTEKLVINEAAKVATAINQFLSGYQNLTITFDGGKIQRPKSTYSVHVTTASHCTFCMELDDVSQLSHTATYILEVLECVSHWSISCVCANTLGSSLPLQTITKVGPWKFCVVTSDNTRNTWKVQQLLCEKYPHIFNIQDGCHLLNLAIKDICLLPKFTEVRLSMPQSLKVLIMHRSFIGFNQYWYSWVDLHMPWSTSTISEHASGYVMA